MGGPLIVDEMLHYTACGLDYVYLVNGFTLHDLDDGRQGYSVTKAIELHEAIARRVVALTRRLQGQEVRFLRGRLDLSQSGLARALEVTRAAVARWEASPHKAIPGSADRSLRYFYMLTAMKHELALKLVKTLNELDDAEDKLAVAEDELKLMLEHSRWKREPVAA